MKIKSFSIPNCQKTNAATYTLSQDAIVIFLYIPCIIKTAFCFSNAFFIAIPLQGLAQNNFRIKGRVVDYDTRSPLKNISIVQKEQTLELLLTTVATLI